jgi:hypothetical protein
MALRKGKEMSGNDTLFMLAVAYGSVDDAVADYEAVKALYAAVKTSHDFDAAAVAKETSGDVEIVKKHEEPTRHGAVVGLGWGLAAGMRRRYSRRSGSACARGRRRCRRSDRRRRRACRRWHEPQRPEGTW